MSLFPKQKWFGLEPSIDWAKPGDKQLVLFGIWFRECGYLGDRVFSVTSSKYGRKQESVDYASEGQPGPFGGERGEGVEDVPQVEKP